MTGLALLLRLAEAEDQQGLVGRQWGVFYNENG